MEEVGRVHSIIGVNINDRLYTILGSNYNRAPFRMLAGSMNNMKGHIYGGDRPVDETRIANFVADAVATGTNEENFLQPLRQVVAIFRYMFDDDVLPQIQRERRQIRRQLAAIATWIPQLQPQLSIWTEFDPAYFAFYADNTRTWLQCQIILIRNQYNAANPCLRTGHGCCRSCYCLRTSWVILSDSRILDQMSLVTRCLGYLIY